VASPTKEEELFRFLFDLADGFYPPTSLMGLLVIGALFTILVMESQAIRSRTNVTFSAKFLDHYFFSLLVALYPFFLNPQYPFSVLIVVALVLRRITFPLLLFTKQVFGCFLLMRNPFHREDKAFWNTNYSNFQTTL